MHYQRSPNVLQRRLGNESLLVPVKGNLADLQKIFSLNPAGETIWRALEQPCTPEELTRKVCDAYNIDEAIASRDVNRFIQEMTQRNLVESTGEKENFALE
jgi:hypothetical protein